MSGIKEHDERLKAKIDNLIALNPDKPYLKGFRYFINNMALTSIYDYVNIVKCFMDFTDKDPSELILDDYSIYTGMLSDKTPSYRIVVHSALKKFSKYLKGNQINLLDPMQYVERPKAKEKIETVEKRKDAYLNRWDIKNLKNNIRNGVGSKRSRSLQWPERDMAIVLILLSTGMRCSALCKLDIGSVNKDNHTITVVDKGSKIREYKLPDEAWDALEEWFFARRSRDNDDPLFVNRYGDRLGYRSVYNMVEKYGGVSPHKLRATYGTQLYNATKDIVFVQNAMGHSSPTTTRLYIRGESNNTDKASEIMSKIISG